MCGLDGKRERKNARLNGIVRRPFFTSVCSAQIRFLPGCILNEEGPRQTQTHTHTHLMCTCGHTDSWGKTLTLTLTCTPPSELLLFCGRRLERATPFSYLCAFNASPLLTHHAHWKPARLCQTYTSLCFSQGKHQSSYRTKMHSLHQGWAGYWSSL